MPEQVPGVRVTSLNQVSHPDRVNRLASAATLSFAAPGLTVIYGDNGSGKSGYVRIIKAACRTKGADGILADVFAASPATGPASATIEYQVKGEDKPRIIKWVAGQAAPAELSQVAVFDSHAAAIYVDEFNELKAVPHSLDCFEKLAGVCDSLRTKLEAELRALRSVTSLPVLNLPLGTSARAFVDALGGKTPAAVEAFASHSEKDDARISELEALVTNPKELLRQLTMALEAAKTVQAVVTKAEPHFTPMGVADLRAKVVAVATAQQAMEVAAHIDMSAIAPLPGLGSTAWRILFEAARDFSLAEAYPDKPFPYLNGDALCVLCQQTLDDDAKTRFQRFQAFVEDAAAKAVDVAASALASHVAEFDEATSELDSLEVQVELIRGRDAKAADAVAEWVTCAATSAGQIRSNVLGDEVGDVSAFPPVITAQLSALVAELEKRAAEAGAALSGETVATTQSELASLTAGKQFTQNKPQVLARVAQHGTIAKLENAIRACATNSISLQGRALLDEYVTDALAGKLEAERKALLVAHIPLSLVSKGEKGAAKHRLKLATQGFQGATSRILSEGEHRAMALAIFLAEQGIQNTSAPMVVDDPVSSLDHIRNSRVAKRLVAEAKSRQVVIFTHDLFFFTTAQQECGLQQVPLKRLAVISTGKEAGVADPDGDPWKAKSLSRRINWLEAELARAKKASIENDAEGKAQHSHNFYFRLRPTWERLVEETLFAGVVLRFRHGVETTRLAEVIVDDTLFKMIHDGMTVTSAFAGHDTAMGPNVPHPEPDEMTQHLEALKACLADINSKSAATKKVRDAMVKAPVAGA